MNRERLRVFGRSLAVVGVLTIFGSGATAATYTYTCTGSGDGTQIQALLNMPAPRVIEVAGGTCNLDRRLDLTSDTTLKGAGIFATKFVLNSGLNTHTVQAIGATQTRISISDLSIDGNRIGNTLGHGIRFGSGTVDNVRIERVAISNADEYGIGFQTGTFTRILVNDVQVTNTGLDGIDFKNTNSLNNEIILSNIRISKFGRDEQANPGPVSGKTGIDIRGSMLLSNIWIEDVGFGHVGIRFRTGEVGNTHGVGGRQSSLSNFRVTGVGGAGIGGIGVDIQNRDNNVSNGYIRDVSIGVRVISIFDSGFESKAINNTITSVECVTCTQAGLKTEVVPPANQIMNLRVFGFRARFTPDAVNTPTGLIISGADNVIVGALANGNSVGLQIMPDATRTILKGWTLTGNTTDLLNQGVASVID